jgi:uncharacterized damage-inducible protein DinB
MTTEILAEYVRYTRWATLTTLDACAMLDEDELRRDLHSSYGSIWGTLVHIYQADSVWWNRFQGNPTSALSAHEPGTGIAELRERWNRVLADFGEWAESRNDQDWFQEFEYRNTRGETFRQPVWEAVMHAVNHATLHRGQVLTMFRQLDRVPTGVDMIFYFRDKAKRGSEAATR